jgi:AcrR family transcriptional regulator
MIGSRERILDSAWEIARAGGAGAVTVRAVARAAGVSRQLVYLQFENRAGLLLEMARRHDRASGFLDRVAATRELPASEALETLIREWCAYMPEILPVARALEAAAVTGDDGGVAWTDRMADLRDGFRHAVARIEAAGELAPGWTVETATDWVWARTHIAGWAHLVVERGWGADEYVLRLVGSLRRELLRDVTR